MKASASSSHAELWPWPHSVISAITQLLKHSLRPYLQTFRLDKHFVSTEFKYSWHSNHSDYWLNVKLTDSYTVFDGTCSIIHLAYWIFPARQVVWRNVKAPAGFTLAAVPLVQTLNRLHTIYFNREQMLLWHSSTKNENSVIYSLSSCSNLYEFTVSFENKSKYFEACW